MSRDLVASTAAAAGILDADVLGLEAFSDLMDGVANADDARRVVLEMKRRRPHLFKPVEQMGDGEFERFELMIGAEPATQNDRLPINLKKINVAALPAAEFEIFDRVLSGRSISIDLDLATLREIAHTQGVSEDELLSWD